MPRPIVRGSRRAAAVAVLALAGVGIASGDQLSEPLAHLRAAGAVVFWEPTSQGMTFDRLHLTIDGPDGQADDRFTAGETISFQVGPDGVYRYELVGEYAPAVTESLVAAGQSGEGQEATDENGRPLAAGAPGTEAVVAQSQADGSQTGAFTVENGVVVDPNLVEE